MGKIFILLCIMIVLIGSYCNAEEIIGVDYTDGINEEEAIIIAKNEWSKTAFSIEGYKFHAYLNPPREDFGYYKEKDDDKDYWVVAFTKPMKAKIEDGHKHWNEFYSSPKGHVVIEKDSGKVVDIAFIG